MSNADEITIHVEEIVAGLVAGGLRDPAWIANAYIERIDPDRRMPDLINGACVVYVQHIACRQLGIVEPKGLHTRSLFCRLELRNSATHSTRSVAVLIRSPLPNQPNRSPLSLYRRKNRMADDLPSFHSHQR